MGSYQYLRKYAYEIDNQKFDYKLNEYFTYLTVKYVTKPTYKLLGGKSNRKLSKTAAEIAGLGVHALMATPLSLGVFAWAWYDQHKNKQK
ncbi:MAG: hypothetical protein KAI26_02995 [Nanoarchaeota archaeon]|nr:hypothetical protein [Nanoarchaeota archaeon]